MDRSTQPRTIQQYKAMFQKGTVSFDHVMQRSYGQWDINQQSNWIHSLAINWPVPQLMARPMKEPVTINGKEQLMNVYYMLEGKQRSLSTFHFIDDAYKLSPKTKPAKIDGIEYEMKNKTFSELDEEVQQAILSYSLSIISVDATDEEIEELFFRWNSGSPLNKTQQGRAIMGTEWAIRFDELSNHPFIQIKSSFSATELKRATHEEAFKQTMLVLDTNDDASSFSAPSLLDYTERFKEDSENKLAIYQHFLPVFDYLDIAFDKKEKVLFKKIHFPASFIAGKYALDNDIHPEEFYDWAQQFKHDFNNPESATIKTKYKDFMGQGSTHKAKVFGRISEMTRHLEWYFTNKKFVNTDLIEILKKRKVRIT